MGNSGRSVSLCDVKIIRASWGNSCWFTACLLCLSSEIQLKSPNWLFGQRKYEEGSSAAKVASSETDIEGCHANDFCNLNWLSSGNDMNEEDVFQRYVSWTWIILTRLWYIFYISLDVQCPVLLFFLLNNIRTSDNLCIFSTLWFVSLVCNVLLMMLFTYPWLFRYFTMTSANESNGWYGGTLLGDQDESSEIYRHYAELCQVCNFMWILTIPTPTWKKMSWWILV